MATERVKSSQSVFDRIESEIVNAFSLIIEQANNRRNQLLALLNELRIQFQMQSQITGLKELEQMRSHLMEMSIKQNFLLKVQEDSLAPIEQQINDLKESVIEPLLRFEYPLTEMLDKMETLGAIIDEQVSVNVKPSKVQRIDYSKKILAKRIIGQQGTRNGEFQYPSRMHVTDNGLLYVVDRDNKRVQVFDAESGNFFLHFGQSHLIFPNGVTSNSEFCYVTDYTQSKIFQFRIGDYALVMKTQKAGGTYKNLNRPAAITTSEEDLLYLSDSENNRVCVYDGNLKYVSEFGVGMLIHPRDVKIYVNEVFVLDRSPHCLHTFDKLGNELRSILTCGEDKQILCPSSFILDTDRNIIVSDFDSQTLKIFSAEGELLLRIGSLASEEVGECFGVVLFKKNLFLTCRIPFHCIKIF